VKTLALACCALAVVVTASVAWAEDSDRIRYYLQLRGQDTNPATGTHDAWGLSLGANLGRYWGLELSADAYEKKNQFGEYGLLALVPQVRLRYPFLHDRLVPYVVGGVGLGLTEFNDRKKPGFGQEIKGKDSSLLVGTLGAGLEYYFADNMAVGLEVKYVFGGDQVLTVDGVPHQQRVQTFLTSLTLRVLVPELRPQPLAEAREQAPTRLYVGAMLSGAITTDSHGFPDVQIRPEPPAYFSTANQFYGAIFGVNFGRYWGVELTAEAYEAIIATRALGSLAEVAVASFVPHLRLRYPLLGGRLVPYGLAGIGLGYAEINDSRPPSKLDNPEGNSFGLAASIGVGIEYFVASNIALGVQARYVTSRGHSFDLPSSGEQKGHFDAVLLGFTLRAFVYDFGRR